MLAPNRDNILLPFLLPTPVFLVQCSSTATPTIFPPYWGLQFIDRMAFLLSLASRRSCLLPLLKFQVNHYNHSFVYILNFLASLDCFFQLISKDTVLIKFNCPSFVRAPWLEKNNPLTAHFKLITNRKRGEGK
ncbi:hypothetical protein mRhiFer1_009770 [Rhinolophus ferrumequinum]|uniref:Uncharacterized protein n=1 Tax=Rhinolophus ferrumequinum TaxID=59479 RepID=A0A7J7ZCX9_RHIFE|nr:hypothetical protein mRhiFer1_009770 [Rhinolophus ferrumequinum]